MLTCPSCGQENPEGFKFCGACGSPIAAPEPAPEEERKVVTALFTDIVGSTAAAEKLDPEDVHARLQPYYARVRHELQTFGGTVEKFIGDAVVAVFGAPIAHEDDPERAVRAALAVKRAVAELNEEDAWLDLHLRTAVHTGKALVVVGARAEEGEGFAAGDVMNTAARIQGGAPVDGIVVGEATYRATAHAFEYREADPVQAKGKAEPIPIWEVLGEKAAPQRPTARTPLVGREDEVAYLTDAWSRTTEERSAQLVTLVGPAGIGKSRLLLALTEEAEQAGAVLWGRCVPYGEGITYWPIAEILEERARIKQSDDPATVSAKLGALLDSLPTSDLDELRTMAAALANLIGTPTTPRGTYEVSQISQQELHWGVRRVLRLIAETEPLLIVIEDLHWAEPTLLELLLYLVEEPASPLLVVASARPELAESNAPFLAEGERRHVRTIHALSDVESAALLGSLLGSAAGTEALAKLLAAAAGNPLFLEETVGMLADTGLEAGAGLENVPVPETLQALIGSRIDGLAAREKRVVQHASVAGPVFWNGAVGFLQGSSEGVGDSVLVLERRDFVNEVRPSSVVGDHEYAFKHILIRDVAYERLPRGRRAELHVRFVDWLHAVSEAAEEEFVEVAAYHLEQSCLLARGIARSPIEPPVAAATAALARAGERAERRGGMREADRYYARALELIDDPLSPDALELRVRRAYTQNILGEVSQAADELSAAAADAALAGRRDARGAALALLGQIDLRQGRVADARTHLTEAAEIATETADKRLQVRTTFRLAALWGDYDGDLERAVAEMTRALQLARELGDRALQVEGHLRLAFFLVNMGDLARAEEALERCLATAAETGSVRDDAQATYLLGLVKYYRGEAEEAERLGLKARDWLERTGETYMGVQNLIALARYALARGEPGEAESRMRDAIPLALDGGGWLVVSVYRYRVLALLAQGHVEEAAELAEFASRNVPEEDPYAQAEVRLMEGALAGARLNGSAALAGYERGIALLEEQQLALETADARVELAHVLVHVGDPERAEAELEEARGQYAAVGALGRLLEVEDVLRVLGEERAGADRPPPSLSGAT